MLSSHSLPETQAALALSIFLATFIYEDGATLLAATLSASGRLDPDFWSRSSESGWETWGCMVWAPALGDVLLNHAGCRNT
jgi:hypothetical protein